MQFSVTFRHMEATEALKTYAKERVQRIRKYFPDPIAVHVVMGTEKYNHRCDVNVQLHNGIKIAGRESTENMYSSIDLVVAKIERQVRRYKDKLRGHKVKSNFAPVEWTHSVIAEEPANAEAAEAEAGANEAAEAKPSVVTRTERFHAEPMSVDQAVMQLNLLHEQFLVFRNDDNGEVNVVYRRGDGSFGLIETSTA
jgi:putative sigma-54 modulation protein